MKAATGELNLTVITMIAIAAIIGFFWVMWPNIKNSINGQWNTVSGSTGEGNNNGMTSAGNSGPNVGTGTVGRR